LSEPSTIHGILVGVTTTLGLTVAPRYSDTIIEVSSAIATGLLVMCNYEQKGTTK